MQLSKPWKTIHIKTSLIQKNLIPYTYKINPVLAQVYHLASLAMGGAEYKDPENRGRRAFLIEKSHANIQGTDCPVFRTFAGLLNSV